MAIPPISILTPLSPTTHPSHHPPEPTLIEDEPPLTHKRTFETLSRWVSRRIVTSPPPTRATAPTASPRHHHPGARALKRAEAGFYLREGDADSGYSTPYTDTDADEEELVDSYAAFCRAFSAGYPEYQDHRHARQETDLPTQEDDDDEGEEGEGEEGGYHYPQDYHYPREEHRRRRQDQDQDEEEFPEINYDYHHTHDYHSSRERFYSRFQKRSRLQSDDEHSYSYTDTYHDEGEEPKATSPNTLAHAQPPPEEYESGYESQSHSHVSPLDISPLDISPLDISPPNIPRRSHSHHPSPPISPPARILTPATYAQAQRAAAQEPRQAATTSRICDVDLHSPSRQTDKHTAQKRSTAQLGRRWSDVRAWGGKVGCWRPR